MNGFIMAMIDWIEDHLDDTFSLDELAKQMGYSPYYCSFKFHQVTGISIRRYVLLRRLYLSTKDLTEGKRVIEITMEYGYSSQEAYSRAFKKVFGVSPGEFQVKHWPVQSFTKLTIEQNGDVILLDRTKEVAALQEHNGLLFDEDVLHIFNGQMMYDEFHSKRLMGIADYVPFNEAMCVHKTTKPIFGESFIEMRANGHRDTVEHYKKIVIEPLAPLFQKDYNFIVLWFGEDVFCQMNLLTMLAYLEQKQFKGSVFLNSFREDEFKVNQLELKLGKFHRIYEDVLMHHKKPQIEMIPVMYQAMEQYLVLQKKDNPVTKYIQNHADVPEWELVRQLMKRFDTLGYGDLQYLEMIKSVRQA